MAGGYRAVLARPGALRLILTGLLGRMPQGMSSLVLLLLVRAATHSYALAGAAVGASALASAVCGPLLGRLVDRVGRRAVVAPAAALQACVYFALALLARAHAPGALLILACALSGALIPPISSVVRTLLQRLYGEPALLETAYAVEAAAQELLWIVGPLLASVVVTLASPVVAVALLGVLGAGGVALFLTSPLVSQTRPPKQTGRPHGAALASADLRWLLAPVALMGCALGAVEVGLPSLALHDGSRAASGLLLALWSLGSMLGGVGYGVSLRGSALGSRYVALLCANCLLTLPLLVAGSIPAACACSLLAGLAIAPALSCQYSLVGRTVLDGTEHEAFSWSVSALVSGVAAGSALAGAAIAAAGVHAPFALALTAASLASIASLRFRGRYQAAAHAV